MTTRREMLTGMAAGAAAALLPGCRMFGAGTLAKERIGVCSWSFRKPLDEVAEEMGRLGISRVHLALQPFLAGAAGEGRHGSAEGAAALERVKNRLRTGQWKISAAMIGFPQEDYSSLETIRRTGGVVPDAAWAGNRKIVKAGAELAAELGAPYLSLHAGFLDENDKAAFAKYVERVTWIRDTCRAAGVKVILESGQETAEDLAKFMPLVEGVGINFDPANMILYGKGDPVAAVKTLAPWIRHVHIKDAKLTKMPGTWGEEVAWGDGEVGQEAFLSALAAAGYDGAFAVEREAGDDRTGDIVKAVKRLSGEAV